MERAPATSPDDLLRLVGPREVVRVSDLRAGLDVSERTIQRRLNALVKAGELTPVGRGLYSRRPPTVVPTQDGLKLVKRIRDSEADAHITGYDVLAGFSHQFVYEYEHLVYCQPAHLSGIASALADSGWRVVPAGTAARPVATGDRVVVLRGQSHAPDRFPVSDHVAAPEKAWVDLLREVRRSGVSFDYGELGRLLNALERGGGRTPVLSAYARRAGYLEWLRATRGERPPANAEQRQLAAGYAS